MGFRIRLSVAEPLASIISSWMWLSNKTAENFRRWLNVPDQTLLVAEHHGAICSVGGATESGEITLNYILPDARFRGLSKAMVIALEQILLNRGNLLVRLTSTQTAQRFFHSMGYQDAGPPVFWGRLPGYPMEKILQ
ncbi:GNAT family N-acetyltransferase [Neorhizobium galegae]|uniref:GNAT family N-acetyltransferase n=1 Tax=Neorhizobium galegae TaxID=399 RepID=UPI00069A7A24|nr:GNAT family N-acetyltransferase [Neorhizobium galegae]